MIYRSGVKIQEMTFVGATYEKRASDFTIEIVFTAKTNWCSSFAFWTIAMNEFVSIVMRIVTTKKWQMNRNKVRIVLPRALYPDHRSQAAGVKPISICRRAYATEPGVSILSFPKPRVNATKKPLQLMIIKTNMAIRSDAIMRNAISSCEKYR
jgi:hypothetical protein